MTVSGLYRGVVSHSRLRPRRHRLRRRIFMTWLDLDELPELGRRLSLFGYNRGGLVSFFDRDHLQGSGDLRGEVRTLLEEAGLEGGGPIRVLCMPRVLGFVFNPISVYFCHAQGGALEALLYEVNNTFGQRHAYLIPVTGPREGVIRQSCEKRFHVSPFMDMTMRYHFKVAEPDGDALLVVDGHDSAGPLIATSFRGTRAELTDRAILKAFLAHPLLALAVLAGIHWEAVKMLLKGLRLRPNPPGPGEPVTTVR